MNWGDRTIGSIVSEIPAAANVFKSFGIDYCCGGGRTLSNAAEEQKIEQSEIDGRLDAEYEKLQRGKDTADFSMLKPRDLSSYIEATHHSYLRIVLPQIGELFGIVLKAHGKNHAELFELHRIFSRLRGDLEQHLIKEETMLFPALGGGLSDEVKSLTREIKAEHEEAGRALKELRLVSNGYTAPGDACATYEKLLAELEKLESDLHQHVHLENNILLVSIQ